MPSYFFSFGVSIKITRDFHNLIVALTILFFATFLGKILSGYLGARFYGLGNTPSLRAGYSMVARGEFSVGLAYVAPAGLGIYVLSGLYILLLAFIGIFSMIYVPNLARGTGRVFRRKSIS